MSEEETEVKPQEVAAQPGSSGAAESTSAGIVPAEILPARKKGKPRGRPFVKGDPRINRKGTKLKPYLHLQEMAQRIGDTKVKAKDGKEYTINEVILLSMAQSKDFREHARFLEIEFGKIPEHLDLTTGGEPILPAMTDQEMKERIIAIFMAARERMNQKAEEPKQ